MQLAGDDKAALAQLERFTDPAAIWKQNKELQTKLSSGKVKFDLPDNATPEQIAQHRKDNGIPETPEGYEIKMDNGIVPSDADKPLISAYLKSAHAAGRTPAEVNRNLSDYFAIQQQALADQAKADVGFHDDSVAALTEEWGGQEQFTRNTTIIGNLMALAPQELHVPLLAARTPDGRRLGDLPLMNKFLHDLGRRINPAATLMPNSSNPTAAMGARKTEIEGMMYINGQQNPGYWKNEAIQKEYRDILDAESAAKGQVR